MRAEKGTAGHTVLLVVILLWCCLLCGAQNQPPPVTNATLEQIAASMTMFVDELPQIPKLCGYTTVDGQLQPAHLRIGMYAKKWQFHQDFPSTTVFAYGTSAEAASVPGPYIEAMQGTPTYVTWENHLPEHHILPFDTTIPIAIPKNGGVPTVVHLHGGIHPAPSDGNTFAWFTANFSEVGPNWSQSTYEYPNVQEPGNLWYHDHALGLTRVNILAGLLAPYVIRNIEKESKLNLPTGPEFDRHLILFDRSFYKDGSLYMNFTGVNPNIHPQWQPEYFGDAIIVNGKAWPYLNVQRRKYRFRIINTSNARYFGLQLTNGLQFTVIGSDTSYLPSPVSTGSILIAPSESADVVIDFSYTNANESVLTNNAPYPYPGGTIVDNLNSKVMKFIISPKPTIDKSTIPKSLIQYNTSMPNTTTFQRYITLYEYDSATGNPTQLFINGKRFEDPVTETPKTGSTEVWEVINLTNDDHPLHIHLANFQAIKVQQLTGLDIFKACMFANYSAEKCNISNHANGPVATIPDYEKTWKNVVKIKPGYITTVVVKFNLVENDAPYPFDATTEPGYVYHCHILDHEDNQMARPLKLIP